VQALIREGNVWDPLRWLGGGMGSKSGWDSTRQGLLARAQTMRTLTKYSYSAISAETRKLSNDFINVTDLPCFDSFADCRLMLTTTRRSHRRPGWR
jgi:hypothetical protein